MTSAMPTAIDTLLELLSSSPRDEEHLTLPPEAAEWSEADRRRAVALLVQEALERGEARAPYLIPVLAPGEEGVQALRLLLGARRLAVRLSAVESLDSWTDQEVVASLRAPLLAAEGSVVTLMKSARIFIRRQGGAAVARWLTETTVEGAQEALWRALWDELKLEALVKRRWAGWGLLYARLKSPLDSIRTDALAELSLRLQAPLEADEVGPTAPPDALQALTQDVMEGQGPPDAARLAALDPALRLPLLLFAAVEVATFDHPRGLDYVVALSGATHRSFVERLSRSKKPAVAAAALRLLETLAPAPAST
jgi:hypothetical protein